MKLEAKIGLFVVMGLSALFLLTTQVTSLGTWQQKGYGIYAYIEDANGLELNSKVLMHGVDIGEVSEIMIDGRRVKLLLVIDETVEIPKDSVVVVMQESMLGAKTINISAGESPQVFASGETIDNYKQYAPFDQTSDSINAAAKELELLMRDLRDVLGEEQKSDLRLAISAFKDVGVNLDAVIRENRIAIKDAINNIKTMGAGFTKTADTVNADLPEIMARVDALTQRLDTISLSLENKLPTAVDKFISIEDNVSEVIQENRATLKSLLTSADSFFVNGQDAFEKVDDLLSEYTVSELQVGLHSNYMFRDQYAKSTVTLDYLPNPETYYMFNVVSMNDYTKLDALGEVIEPGMHDEGKIYFSGQYGKRYGDTLLHAGVIESTGGLGVDYFADNDRFKVGVDAYDFSAINDKRGDSAHMRIKLRYRFLKHVELYGGWDNFLNSDAQNVYFGIGMKFIDNNLKYMLGTSSMML